MTTAEVINSGKTKMIVRDPGLSSGLVKVVSEDDITGGDGLKHDIMSGKAVCSTITTSNNFQLLEAAGIPTAFHATTVEPNVFLADELDMIPIELVARRYGYGSLLKRHPEFKTPDGEPPHRFERVLVEFFEKDDDLSPPQDKDETKNDPLMVVDLISGRVLRYRPKWLMAGDFTVPGSGFVPGLIDEQPLEDYGLTETEFLQLKSITIKTFLELERQWWEKHNIAIADFKIECGRRVSDGKIVVGDVIDNDSWRIWPNGDPTKELAKENYRQGSKSLDDISEDYQLVAELSKAFF